MAEPARLRAAALRTTLWLLLGGWFGSWLSFGILVAPTAFRVLPTTEVAGKLVGPVLTALHLYGAVAGIALAAVTRALGRSTWLVVTPLMLSAVCLYTHFGVSAEIAEIRDSVFGPGGNVAAAARFQLLHRVSMTLFIGMGLVVAGLIGAHAGADAGERGG